MVLRVSSKFTALVEEAVELLLLAPAAPAAAGGEFAFTKILRRLLFFGFLVH
jgi:hypothetical protein